MSTQSLPLLTPTSTTLLPLFLFQPSRMPSPQLSPRLYTKMFSLTSKISSPLKWHPPSLLAHLGQPSPTIFVTNCNFFFQYPQSHLKKPKSHLSPHLCKLGETTEVIIHLGNSAPVGKQMVPTLTDTPKCSSLSSFLLCAYTPFTPISKVQRSVSWGDPITSPSPHHIRILFQNCNSFNQDYFERFTYLNKIVSYSPTIVGLSENNINWANHSIQEHVAASLKTRWPHNCMTIAHTPNSVPSTSISIRKLPAICYLSLRWTRSLLWQRPSWPLELSTSLF
jgi:hypothetical protein